MNKKLVNIEELSAYLGLPISTIYTWTHQKKIPHVKMGRTLRFDLVEIDEWVDERKVAQAAIRRPAFV